MNARVISIGAALATVASVGLVLAQTPPPTTVDGLVSAAKVAAGTDWSGTFLRLCIPPPATGRGATPGAGRGRAGNATTAGAAPAGRAAAPAAAGGRAGRGAASDANVPAGPARE